MDDEFNEYLGKFNEEMNDKYVNPGADRSFLDKKERPSDSMIVNLFITDEDMLTAVDLTDYNISELGKPDKIKTIEGTEWVLSKLVWYKKEGRVITFDIIQLSATIDDIIKGKDELTNPIASFREKEITFEDVNAHPLGYHARLASAIENEDFIEAARLRDWLKEFKLLSGKVLPLLKKAIDDENFNQYNKLMRLLNNHTESL